MMIMLLASNTKEGICIVSYRIVSCRVVSCRVVSCRVVSCRIFPSVLYIEHNIASSRRIRVYPTEANVGVWQTSFPHPLRFVRGPRPRERFDLRI
jgi:hypothetical protein